MVLHSYTLAGMPGLLFGFPHEFQARHCTAQRDDAVIDSNSDLCAILWREVMLFEIPLDNALDRRVRRIRRSVIARRTAGWEFDTVVASRIEPFPNRIRGTLLRFGEADFGLLG